MSQWQGGTFDIKAALEEQKAAAGPRLAELAAASKRAENRVATSGRSSKKQKNPQGGSSGQERSTIMFRNIPQDCTRAAFQSMLDSEGFAGQYDFLYLAHNFDDWSALGYGFVNFVEHQTAERAMKALSDRVLWPDIEGQLCEVSWSKSLQGLQACIRGFRNSPVMHPCVNEKYKPVLMTYGRRCSFPEPTKSIQIRSRPA